MRSFAKSLFSLSSILLAMGVACEFGAVALGQSVVAVGQEFGDLLDVHTSHIDSISPASILVKTTVTDGIPGRPESERILGSSIGRLLLDKEAGHLQWCSVQSNPAIANSDDIRFVDVNGDRATTWHVNSRVKRVQDNLDWNATIESSHVPQVRAWGLSQLPVPETFSRSLELLKAKVGTDNPNERRLRIARSTAESQVTYKVVFLTESAKKYDVLEQSFLLPDYRPNLFVYSRAAKGKPVKYFSTEVVWSDYRGVDVPAFLFGKSARIVREGDKLLRGERYVDVELDWEAVRSPVEFLDTTSEPTLQRLQAFFVDVFAD